MSGRWYRLIAASAEEVWSKKLVMKAKEPLPQRYVYLHKSLLLAAEAELTGALVKSGGTAVAYETEQSPGG